MTILCLHGSFGSASNFKIQLAPFVDAVTKSGSAQFKWINGAHTAVPPPGFESYFGSGPLYRFVDFDGVHEFDNMQKKLREFPEGMTAEDTIRTLLADKPLFTEENFKMSLDRLIDMLDNDPEIDGILGYSEGATVAATLILEEKRRFEEEGRPRRIKSAVFFAGWPPAKFMNGAVEAMLADEDELENMIDVPTCHIVGCNDPYIHGAMALFGMCDEDTAMLFDHGKGHTVPRDARTLEELSLAVNGVWAQASTTTAAVC